MNIPRMSTYKKVISAYHTWPFLKYMFDMIRECVHSLNDENLPVMELTKTSIRSAKVEK